MSGTKSTINISSELLAELRSMVEDNEIPSLTSGINSAIDMYIKMKKKEKYRYKMEEAANDKAYVLRTIECQSEYDCSADEVEGQW
jgi:metal-responsive CopG/Arc/MetJ family transcriptional regulator